MNDPNTTVATRDWRDANGRSPDDLATREKRWENHRFAIVALDDVEAPWACKMAAAFRRLNASGDPDRHLPRVFFKGNEAVRFGATDAHLAALAALAPNDIDELTLHAAALRRDRRRQVETLARRLATERDTTVAAPDPITLTQLLDEPDEGPAYRVDGVWPIGGNILFAAQFKSGKSTAVGNVVRPLVDGGQFLEKFDVEPVDKVVLVDTELDRRTQRRWFRDQKIVNTDKVTVVSLRGAVSTFDILDPAIRTQWAQRLAGADVVILDCLRPVLDALGLSEDKDAGKMLVAFDALLAEIGAGEGMVVTHMGHNNERARGDSRLLDWPDALWKIVRDGGEDTDDGSRRRYFSALGRDVALPEGLLAFDAATRHLTFTDGGGRKDSTAVVAMPDLMAMVRAMPGELSKNTAEKRLVDEFGFSRREARASIERAIRDKSIAVTEGPRRAQLLSPGVDPIAAAFEAPDAAPEGGSHV